MSNSFYITKLRSQGGPWIFTNRLKDELIRQKLSFTKESINSLSIIQGSPQENKFNILRLDGLYFHKCRQNKDIFKARDVFDHIVYQGDFCKKQYDAFTGEKKNYSIIPNGVPEIFFEKSDKVIPQKNPVVVASAHWRRHKRLEEIINAFTSSKLKNVELWVLGGTHFKGHITKNIKLLPHYPPKSLPQVLQSATAMIHLAWLDWCPNSVVEGLACGLPVLCSHNGGTKELVKNDGIIIQLEEDYQIGTMLDLYKPPKVDTNIIINGVKELIELPKIKVREDLKIKNTAIKYKKLFK